MRRAARNIAAITALLGVVLSTHGPLVARALFEMRQDVLAANHCENRFDPSTKCDGFCILKKHLADHEHREHEHATSQAPVPLVLFASDPAPVILPPPAPTAARDSEPVLMRSSAHQDRIEHPPRIG